MENKFNKLIYCFSLSLIASLFVLLTGGWGKPALSLPPASDTPEEILRMEIITAARSPIDGKSLTAAEYVELQAQLRVSPPPKLNTKIRENVFLLQLRKTLLQIFPFLNF